MEGVSSSRRLRTAGTTPRSAKSQSHTYVLQRQQDMLRRAPVSAPPTAPSIPSGPISYRGQPAKQSKPILFELERHARKDNRAKQMYEKGNFIIMFLQNQWLVSV